MVPTRQCERCRGWVALDLDAELSEIGTARLRRHLAECAECRAYAADVRGATALLRSAPLVEPDVHVSLPQLRRRRFTLQGAAASVAALAAVAAMALVTGVGGDRQSGPVEVSTATGRNVDLMTLREQRRAQLFRSMTNSVSGRTRATELY